MNVSELLQKRLLLVTGKGGTGKTTLSVALARLAAEQGKKTILLEVDNQHPSLTDYFDRTPSYKPTAVAPGLDIANVTWVDALEDWVRGVMPIQRIVRLVLSHRMVRMFLDVAPGSRELSVLDRIINHTDEYDIVIVDLPASGHALYLLRVPFRSQSLFPTGPIRRLCDRIMDVLSDPSSVILQTSLPEEMVANETIETWRALRETSTKLTVPTIFLNQSLTPSLTEEEKELLRRLARRHLSKSCGISDGVAPTSTGDPNAALVYELVLAGVWEAEREDTTAEALRRLQEETSAELFTVPLLSGSEGPDGVALRIQAILRRHFHLERQGDEQ